MFPHKAFWPSVNLSLLQPVVKLCMCNLFFLLPSRLPRWGAACWSTCLQSLPNFFGCKAVDRKDGPSKSTIFTLETEKAVGIQHLAEKLRLSQAVSAGLLNNMHILVQWYGYFFFFSCWSKTCGDCLIPALTTWKMIPSEACVCPSLTWLGEVDLFHGSSEPWTLE